ncbi:hypothetical protein GEMRC1_003863 [Eukaryota sp. GEM-RC1]
MIYYNSNFGFLDALVRGKIGHLLTAKDYSSLCECSSISDLRIHLSHSEYPELRNESSDLDVGRFRDVLMTNYVSAFHFIKSTSTSLLSQFLDYCTYGYMIDNITLIIQGSLRGSNLEKLIHKCHPLGLFKNLNLVAAASTPEEVYRMVLIDTPLAGYFEQCITATALNDLHIEIIRNTLYKCYLEDFHRFVSTKLSKVAGASLLNMLEFEADRRKISITLNSLTTDLTRDERVQLFPDIGRLSPQSIKALRQASSVVEVEQAVRGTSYESMLKTSQSSQDLTMDDLFYRSEIMMCKNSCLAPFNFSVFYSWMRMKEQEIRNLVWIFQCIDQNQIAKIQRYISIY